MILFFPFARPNRLDPIRTWGVQESQVAAKLHAGASRNDHCGQSWAMTSKNNGLQISLHHHVPF